MTLPTVGISYVYETNATTIFSDMSVISTGYNYGTGLALV
jgi:hypothetical protein